MQTDVFEQARAHTQQSELLAAGVLCSPYRAASHCSQQPLPGSRQAHLFVYITHGTDPAAKRPVL